MSEQTHVKDWYVAQWVMLTNENKRLTRELAYRGEQLRSRSYHTPLAFVVGYFLACIMWRAFK
jgi:hypothetical protein